MAPGALDPWTGPPRKAGGAPEAASAVAVKEARAAMVNPRASPSKCHPLDDPRIAITHTCMCTYIYTCLLSSYPSIYHILYIYLSI